MPPDLPQLIRPGGSKYGLRDQIAANLDKAMEQVCPNDRFMWEVSYPVTQQVVMTPAGPQAQLQMNNWLVLCAPPVDLSRGSIMSGLVVDLRKIADDPEVAVEAIRKLAQNIRNEIAAQLNSVNLRMPPSAPR